MRHSVIVLLKKGTAVHKCHRERCSVHHVDTIQNRLNMVLEAVHS